MKKLACFFLAAAVMAAGLCACRPGSVTRPDFDAVRITCEDGQGAPVIRESSDPAVLDELWELYAGLTVYNVNRPQGYSRYTISYMKDGEVVEEWRICQTFVVSGGRFGTNHTLANTNEVTGDPSYYNRITELFRGMQSAE